MCRRTSAGLRAGGFREPEDVQIVARITEGDASKLAPMAADLIGQSVDLIVAVGPAAVRAVRAATSTIPIVASDLESDPVKAGFVASVARPGGNLTGTFLDFPDFGKKWLEVLKENTAEPRNGGRLLGPDDGRHPNQCCVSRSKDVEREDCHS
jgi:putative tryptophan/tyrosine transport system substrate-binding protein